MEPREANESGFLSSCNRRLSDSKSMISDAFRDREGCVAQGISGINLPSVDSKLRNIYNFSTGFISTEGGVCAISDYC